MTTMDREPPSAQQPVSGWAAGGIVFAATMMLMIGAFQAVAGLTAIIEGRRTEGPAGRASLSS